MKLILKILLGILVASVVLAILFVVVLTLAEYKPDWIEPVSPLSTGSQLTLAPVDRPITFVSWNIGYASLDAQNDFVMDGGTQSLARSANAVVSNMQSIEKTLADINADMIFLQEVDKDSRRSFKFNEIDFLIKAFPRYEAFHAKNFDAIFVPFPVSNMMGRTYSGLLTMSSFKSTSALSYQLPGEFDWPIRIANLKRCMSVLEIPTAHAGKMLYAINVHLSAYDSGGFLRSQELEFVRQYIVSRYNEGHYVVVGGDWNSLFPAVDINHFPNYTTTEENLAWVQRIPDDIQLPNWTWAYDPNVPTVRTLEKSYVAGENFTGIIDGFLLSPNVVLDRILTQDMQFSVSDHHPVVCTVTLK